MESFERVMGGRFRLGRVLGQGGMGTVHEALDLMLERPVALKVLQHGLASDEHQVARFEREAKAAARLSHPNIVGVTELVRDEELGLGLVMELLSGMSLGARLHAGPLPEAEAISVFMQVLDGLGAAHAAGMVHRDLKPSNLFLVPIAGGVLVKILDFGIVKLAEDGAAPKLTRKGALIGTPTYMSPEQVMSQPVDARSDVYSLGACLYETLLARPPYDGPHTLALIAAVGAGPPPDVREIDGGVSQDLAHIVRVAMARDPEARYQSCDAMREALRCALPAVRAARAPRPKAAAEASVTVDHAVPLSTKKKGKQKRISMAEERAASLRAEPPPPSSPPSDRDEPIAPPPTDPRIRIGLGVAALALVLALAFAFSRGVEHADVPPPRATTTEPAATRPPPVRSAPVVAPSPAAPIVEVPEPPRVEALPIGVDPPPEPIARPSPAPRSRPPHPPAAAPDVPTSGRVGEDVLDPFAH